MTKPKLILERESQITISQDKYGVEIKETDQMNEEYIIVISYDRLEKVIACLHQIHMKRENKKWIVTGGDAQ
jgi:hypothetical protein